MERKLFGQKLDLLSSSSHALKGQCCLGQRDAQSESWRALNRQQRRSGGGHPTHSFKDPHQRRMVLSSFTPVSFETETGNQGEIIVIPGLCAVDDINDVRFGCSRNELLMGWFSRRQATVDENLG